MRPDIDWDDWRRMQAVELWQAVMLSCDEDPGDEELDPVDGDLPSSASAEAARRARIAGNAVAVQLPVVRQNAAYFLRSTVELAVFAAWARDQQHWALPCPMEQMADDELLKQQISKPGPLELMTSAKGNGPNTVKAENECVAWLADLRKAGPPEKNKNAYLEDAKARYKISDRGFERAWRDAASKVPNEEWSKPGRRRKS